MRAKMLMLVSFLSAVAVIFGAVTPGTAAPVQLSGRVTTQACGGVS